MAELETADDIVKGRPDTRAKAAEADAADCDNK